MIQVQALALKKKQQGPESLNIDPSVRFFADSEVCRESQPQLGEDRPTGTQTPVYFALDALVTDWVAIKLSQRVDGSLSPPSGHVSAPHPTGTSSQGTL